MKKKPMSERVKFAVKAFKEALQTEESPLAIGGRVSDGTKRCRPAPSARTREAVKDFNRSYRD